MKEDKAKVETKKKKSDPALTISIISMAFVIFMFAFIYTGPLKRYHQSETSLGELRQRVEQLVVAKDSEVARLRSQEQLMERLKQRKPNFDLWSFMNTMLTETNLKDRAVLENFKPRNTRTGAVSEDVTMVQLKLAGVTLGEMVDLLHKIYSSDDLVVLYRLDYLKPAGDGKGLECNVTFMTPKELEIK